MIRQQPKGLYLLCFTELWERFGFYTLQTIIILYMSKGLLFSDDHAHLLYGAFSSLLYLTPVLGGFVADRFIGFKHAMYILLLSRNSIIIGTNEKETRKQ